MPKFVKELAWRASFILLGILLSPVATTLFGEAYPEFIKRQPRRILVAVLIGTGTLLVVGLLIQRARATKKLNIDRQVPSNLLVRETECFAFLEYKSVFWMVEFPTFTSLDYFPFGQKAPTDELKRTKLDRFTVDYTPICPECSHRLDEWDTFFGWYRWTCPECGFKKSLKRSFETEMKHATLLARKEIKKIRSGEESKMLALKKGYEGAFITMKKGQ